MRIDGNTPIPLPMDFGGEGSMKITVGSSEANDYLGILKKAISSWEAAPNPMEGGFLESYQKALSFERAFHLFFDR